MDFGDGLDTTLVLADDGVKLIFELLCGGLTGNQADQLLAHLLNPLAFHRVGDMQREKKQGKQNQYGAHDEDQKIDDGLHNDQSEHVLSDGLNLQTERFRGRSGDLGKKRLNNRVTALQTFVIGWQIPFAPCVCSKRNLAGTLIRENSK